MGALLERSVSLLVSHIMLFGGIVLCVLTPISLGLNYYLFEVADASMVDEGGAFMLTVSLYGWANTLIGTLAYAAITFATPLVAAGETVSVAQAMGGGIRRWAAVIGVTILTNIATTVGMILLIVPGIWLAIHYSLAIPLTVLEERGVSESMKRSGELVSGKRWLIFGLGLLYFVGSIVGTAVLQYVFAFAGITEGFLSETLVETGTSLLSVVFTIALTLLYLQTDPAEYALASDQPDEATPEEIAAARAPDPNDDGNPFRAPRF